MAKKFNQWLDEFVENGADPKDVTNWPENAGGGQGGEAEHYVVTLSDLTIPEGYNPSAGNMTFGWTSNEKITFSESLAKIIKETKRPLAISYSILHALCPRYYTDSASYDYIIFYPSSSRCYKEPLDETYDLDELITYESLEETQSIFGDFVSTSYKIEFDFNKTVEGDVQNPKEALEDVYSGRLFFERNLKYKSLYNFIDIYSSDFNKLKYNGSVTIRVRYNFYDIGANEIMCGITIYEPDGSADLETMVTFTRPTGMINMYCTQMLLFYDFYAKADYICDKDDAYITLTRVDKPTYKITLTNFVRYAQDGRVSGWDALDIGDAGKLEFIFSKEKMDSFVTKVATIVDTYYPTLETPQNMMDVINVLNNLFNISKGYADASSPIIPFAFCQLIASADSVTNVKVSSTNVVSHTVQTSCNLDNNKISIICFSDFAGTLGGDTLVEDDSHYYRLSGNWTIS